MRTDVKPQLTAIGEKASVESMRGLSGKMAIHIERLSGLMESGAARLGPLILLTFLCLIGAVVFRGQVWQMAFASGAATFAVFTAVFFFASVADTYARSKSKAELAAYAKRDHVPTIFGDRDGQVTLANRAATSTFSLTGADTVQRALTPLVSNAPALIRRLNTALQDADQTSEIVSIPQGQMTVHAQKLDRDTKIWRFEMPRLDADSDEVEGSTLPSFMVSKSGVILFMNRAARFLIGKRVASMRDVFPACSVTGGTICDVQTAKGPASYLLAELPAGGGRLMVYLLPPPEVEMAQWPTFHELPVALLKLAQDGRVIAHNDAAMSLLGDPLSDAVNVSSLLEGLGRPVEDWLGEVHAGRAIQQSEFLRLKRAEREAFVQVALSRVEEGGKAFVLAVVTDATELKTLEAQFVQSQKMQAIGQLAGGIAHDFNNLLTAISGHCDLLLVRHDPADSDYADLQQITQNTNRAASLVSQLLAFSRKQTLRPEPLDLRDTLADLTHLLNRLVGEKVMLSLAQDPDLGNIRADKRQLEQVLMNLVVNARDAMPSGGQIRIETEALTLSKPLERDKVTVPSGDYISLRVTDEGTGIQSDKLDKIFEPFYTTKRTGEGTGLGLSMVYGIVKQSGGYVFVDSQVGSGTCFSLLFPAIEKTFEPAASPKKAQPARSIQRNFDNVILLVEDEEPVRAFASRALQREGYTVVEANSGEEALQALANGNLNVDLFVTDVVMPGRDGPSWVREALKAHPEVGVVFVSGYAEDKLEQSKAKIPNSVFLPKPFSLVELTETVNRQLH